MGTLTATHGKADQMVVNAKRKASPISTSGQGGGVMTTSDSVSTARARRGYARNRGWTYAAIRPIAVRIAKQPFRVGRIVPIQKGDTAARNHLPEFLKGQLSESTTAEIVENHVMLKALADPNPMMTEWTLKYITAAGLQLTARCFWWMLKSKRNPWGVDVWPVPAHWVTHKDGANWKVTIPESGKEYIVPKNDMAYFYYPDAADPYGSWGPMDAADQSAEISEKIRQAQSSTFDNVAMPIAVFHTGLVADGENEKSKPEFTDEQKQSIEYSLRQAYRGVGKWGGVLVTDKTIDKVELMHSKPFEMDFPDSAKTVKDEVMQIFGVNPSVTGQLENSNRSSATVATESFLDNVVNPLAILISQVMTMWVLPFFDQRKDLVAWLEEAKAYDPDQRREDNKFLLGSGALLLDEARAAMGLPPMPNGMGQCRSVPVGVMLEGTDGSNMLEDLIPQPAAAPAADQQQDNRTRSVRKNYMLSWLRVHSYNEDQFAGPLAQFFRLQVEQITEQIKLSDGHWTPESVFVPEDWDKKLLDITQPLWARAAFVGAAMAQVHTGQSKALTKDSVENILMMLPEDVQVAIRATMQEVFAEPYWKDINLTTMWRLKSAFARIMSQGMDLRMQVAEIQKVLGGRAAGARAINIARTEVTGALNAGNHSVLLELADQRLIGGRSWLATRDEYTRDAHNLANGQTVGPSELFVLYDPETGITEYAPYPGYHKLSPKQRCNCRCSEISERSGARLGSRVSRSFRALTCAH